jgi:Zn-dependent M28 family amino/carboxypeptidase
MPVELLFLDGEEAVRLEWVDPDNRYGSRYYVESAKKDGSLPQIAALILVDMIGDANLGMKRESQSTSWLTDVIWETAARMGRKEFLAEETPIEDDHIPFLEAGVPAVDLIDLEYDAWHTPRDTMDKLSAKSFQAVGDVLLAALPAIEKRLSSPAR